MKMVPSMVKLQNSNLLLGSYGVVLDGGCEDDPSERK